MGIEKSSPVINHNHKVKRPCYKPNWHNFLHHCNWPFDKLSVYFRPSRFKAPTHRPDSNQHPTAFIRPLCCLWPVRQKSCIEHTASTCCQLHSSNKWVVLVYKKDTGQEVYAHNSRSKQNLTISNKNSCILNMQPGITKQTQINSSWLDITASLVPVLQNMKTGNDGTECVEKQSAHSIPPFPHTVLIR